MISPSGMIGLKSWIAAALCAALSVTAPATAGEVLDGPIRAVVLRVIDGDTIAVKVRVWLGQDIEVVVRIAGIDAPERRGACAAEKRLAEQSRDFLAERLSGGTVALSQIRRGKYAGRVVATVSGPAVADWGHLLVAAGLARPYDGGRRAAWCDPEVAAGPP